MRFVQCRQGMAAVKLSLLSVFCILIAGLPLHANAAPGDLDPTFGAGGRVITLFGYLTTVQHTAIQSDGKIVAVGQMGQGADYSLVRYNVNGSLDNTFGAGGKVTVPLAYFSGSCTPSPGNAFVSGLVVQRDGKIVLAGSPYNSGVGLCHDFNLARYNSDGSLDGTFGTGGLVVTDFNSLIGSFGSIDQVASIILQHGNTVADDKIIAVGASNTQIGCCKQVILSRYNTADGSLDSTFGTGGKIVTTLNGGPPYASPSWGASDIAIQTDGKIVIAGSYIDATQYIVLARYSADGVLDNTFGSSGIVTSPLSSTTISIESVAIQTDGRILVKGSISPDFHIFLAGFNADGSLDTGFGLNGLVTESTFRRDPIGLVSRNDSMAIQKNGKIVVAGATYGAYFTVARYNMDGTPDNTFGSSGKVMTVFVPAYVNCCGSATSISIQTDGKIVAAGRAVLFNGSNNFGLARYTGDPVEPSLVSIDVTPEDPIALVGQTQQFMATGTFSDGTTRILTSGADSWTSRAPMPTARGQLAAGVINDIVYAIGGFFSDPSYITHATLEAYDPLTDTWSSKAPMPTPRSTLGTGVVNGILYAVGGHNTYNLETVEAYDPATDSWTTKASMFTSRSEVGVGVVGGILYAVGGYGGAGTLADVEAYDPTTDTWTTKTPMPTPRTGPAVAVVNGILYAIGGNVGQTSLTVVEAYNPSTDTWTTKAPIPSARCCMGSGVIDGMIYVAGGFNSLAAPSYVPVFEAYDPATDTWTTKDPVPTNVFGNAVGVVNSVLYSIGGFSPGVPPTYNVITLDAVYAYAPPGEVTWSSSDIGVATIDPIGLATGLGPGPSMITATSGSISGTTMLTVNALTYTLTLNAAGTGSGMISGAGTYNSGQTATVSAAADAGSIFDGWTGPDAAECATGSVLMESDKICTANFTLSTQPDLIMTDVTPDASTATQGGTLSVTDTVMNQGTPSTVFRNAYHLSTDNVYGNGDDVMISTIRVVTSLGAGASNTATTSLSIPSTAPGGTYYLCAMADSVNQVVESNETNNSLCSGATVTLPKADLVMTAVSTATTAIAPGKTLSLSNSVKNQGGFKAGSFRIGFYLSVNSDGSTPDVAISATRTLSSLSAGASSTGTTSLTIPSATPPDNYYLCAMADSLNQVPETDEGNNVLCTGSTIQVALPDLSMTDLTPNAATAVPGGTLSVTTTVSNGGSASGAFRIGFRLSGNTIYGDGDDVVITVTRSVTSLAAGASSTGTTSLTLPGSTPSGDYFVCTLADSLNQVAESDEGNNTLCSGTQVNVP